MSDITIIKQNAIKNLNEAKQICFKANKNLTNSFNKLSIGEKLSIDLIFFLNSLNNQLNYFKSIKNSINLLISNFIDSKSNLFKKTNNEIEQLDKILNQMKLIKIDPSLNNNNNNNNTQSLYDYINIDHINELKLKIKDLYSQIDNLIDNKIIENIIKRLQNEWNFLSNEFELLNSLYKKYFNRKENEMEIDDLVKNNSDLELEVIDILKKLNNHLDNCMDFESQSNYNNNKQYNQIQIENNSIPNLMNSLKNNCYIISENCNDIEKNFTIYKDFKIKLIKCFKEIKDFSINVLENQVQNNLLKISVTLNDHFHLLNIYNDEINQFSSDFLQFIDSYYNLILEINRRSILNKKVKNLIDDFQNDLKLLQDDDFIKRNQFINDNADFLPQNLVNFDLINSKFPSLQLNYSLENLPTLNKETIEESIQKLKRKN